MSNLISVVTNQNDAWHEEEAVVHYLPFGLDYNGPAKVQNYFIIRNKDNSDYFSSTFRGRELKGKLQSLPEQYLGLILREDQIQQEPAEDGSIRWNLHKYFRKFYYWNRELDPSENDRVQRLLKWTEISQSIHAPVTQQELTRQFNEADQEEQNQPTKKRQRHTEEYEEQKEEKEELSM